MNKQIKSEADEILDKKGLRKILLQYGTPHISGSYALDLMTWRDLDIYLEVKDLSEKNFFLLGADIASLLQPLKMHYRNELLARTTGLPFGLYWGIYIGDERKGAWKIDIWCVDATESKRLLKFCHALEERITPTLAIDIMTIKSQCWTDPQYRRTYTSIDIYNAVLDSGARTLEEFRKTLDH